MTSEKTIPSRTLLSAYSDSKTMENSLFVVLLILVCLPILIFRLETYPRIWFDEGYKLNAAYTLAQDGLYATYTTNGFIPFDPGTSSGPADILPTALALKLLGTSVTAARLTSVIYTLIAAISLFQIGRYLWGRKAALLCVLLIIAMPPINQVSLILMGRQSLSEAAAFSLMVLGLWMVARAWHIQSLRWAVLSGIVMGLGILSKTQLAIGLGPALLTVSAWRWWRERRGGWYLFAPVTTMVAVFLAWMLMGQLLTPPDIRLQNSTLLMDAIRTNIFTGLFGSNLDTQSMLIVGIMLVGSLTNVARILRYEIHTQQQWIELILVLFTLFITLWFILFSVGWPRYAYAGLVIGLFLMGRFVWGGIQWLSAWVKSAEIGAMALLLVAALGINLFFINKETVKTDVQAAAAYIATEIPGEAVIESWEWELDMLSQHRPFHHPAQENLFEAIRQNSRHQPFHLTYDVLQANPDYLILGTFGTWTGIYSQDVIASQFTLVDELGVYRIYKRNTINP